MLWVRHYASDVLCVILSNFLNIPRDVDIHISPSCR